MIKKLTEKEIKKIGKSRVDRLKKLLDDGTPFIDEYKKLIELEKKEMRKVLSQIRE